MKIIGLIGGSGTGKSSVARAFASLGLVHIDCDVIAREVVMPGQPCLQELIDYFGDDIADNGILNRSVLAQKAFASAEQTKMLNEITHKYILKEIDRKIATVTDSPGVIVDAAALAESGYLTNCDYVVAVTSCICKRIRRIMKRDKLSYQKATHRIKAQKPNSFYRSYADFVISNNTTMTHLTNKVSKIYQQIFLLSGGNCNG